LDDFSYLFVVFQGLSDAIPFLTIGGIGSSRFFAHEDYLSPHSLLLFCGFIILQVLFPDSITSSSSFELI
jgi:hypothetical protein